MVSTANDRLGAVDGVSVHLRAVMIIRRATAPHSNDDKNCGPILRSDHIGPL